MNETTKQFLAKAEAVRQQIERYRIDCMPAAEIKALENEYGMLLKEAGL